MMELWLIISKEARAMPDSKKVFKTTNSMDARVREHPLKSSGKVLN